MNFLRITFSRHERATIHVTDLKEGTPQHGLQSRVGAGCGSRLLSRIIVFERLRRAQADICYPRKAMSRSIKRAANCLLAIALGVSLLLLAANSHAQQGATAPSRDAQPKANNTEFAAAADEVLQQVSDITGMKLLTPLKKTLRSRDEIRAYLIREMDDEKNPAQRYADARSAEAFGLLPKGFDLDNFMIDLLTEQIAGLYDPKAREFYIADWIPLDDQRMVMAHELTHALQDQHFHIDAWTRAARPNDDAELAREAVLEGSAMAAMIDYLLKGTGHSVEDLPSIDPSVFAGDMSKTPKLQEAPQFLKDGLVFPYYAGLTFSAAILKPSGWYGLSEVFAKPPLSTQQIMHPALYKSGKVPAVIAIPSIEKLLGADWSKLDENVMGEFGWREILKQFLGEEVAKPVAAAWEGDRYALYEQKQNKKLILIARLRLDRDDHSASFFTQYSEALGKKYGAFGNASRFPNFLSFDAPEGSVFLRCVERECLSIEGASRAVFDGLNGMIGWTAAPSAKTAGAAPRSSLKHGDTEFAARQEFTSSVEK